VDRTQTSRKYRSAKHRPERFARTQNTDAATGSRLENPAGYVLPLQWAYQKNSWISCEWEFRGGKMMLIPGNSQMGYRLPLDSLARLFPNRKAPKPAERSLFEESETLG
jgi:uncharacterized protein (DUF2126 family)